MASDGFDLNAEQLPHVFIQWKGTTPCMDFHCECGAFHHVCGDYFCYAVKCHECGAIWEMPQILFPRRVATHNCIVITQPRE